MYKGNNLFRNLIKIRDETLKATNNMEHIITCLTLLVDDPRNATQILKQQYPDTYGAIRSVINNHPVVGANDPEGQFYIGVRLLDNDTSEVYTIAILDLQSNVWSSTNIVPLDVQDDDYDVGDMHIADLSNGEDLTILTALQRINDGYSLKQLVLAINDSIMQNGKIETASISEMVQSMSIQRSDSVNTLLMNLAGAGVVTGWKWTTMLYEMYKSAEEAINNSSLILDSSKPNVIQGFISFGFETLINTVADVLSIVLAQVTHGVSILINLVFKGIQEVSEQVSSSTEYSINGESMTDYLNVPIVSYKRAIESMASTCYLRVLMNNRYATYVDTPLVDYFLWSDGESVYANGFLKLRMDPESVVINPTSMYVYANNQQMDPDSQRMAEILTDNTLVGKMVAASVSAYIAQSLLFSSGMLSPDMGDYGDYWSSRRMPGLKVQFNTGIPNTISVTYPEDYYHNSSDESFKFYRPRHAIAAIFALIHAGDGSLQGAAVGEVIKLLQLATRYADVTYDGTVIYWNTKRDFWSYGESINVPITQSNTTCVITPLFVDMNIDGGYSSGTGSVSCYLSGFEEWIGVAESLGETGLSDYPILLLSNLWCEDGSDAINNFSYTLVDTIPADRMVTLPKYDRKSLIISLAIIGAVSSAILVAGALISKTVRIRRNRSAIVRKEKLDTMRRAYLNNKTPESLAAYEKQIRRYNLLANLFNWRLYDGSTGMYVNTTVASSTTSIFPTILGKIEGSDNHQNIVENDLSEIIGRLTAVEQKVLNVGSLIKE